MAKSKEQPFGATPKQARNSHKQQAIHKHHIVHATLMGDNLLYQRKYQNVCQQMSKSQIPPHLTDSLTLREKSLIAST